MRWLSENASWIFSGVGIVLFTGVGYLIKRFLSREAVGQSQKTDRGSVAIQAGGDVLIGGDNKNQSK